MCLVLDWVLLKPNFSWGRFCRIASPIPFLFQLYTQNSGWALWTSQRDLPFLDPCNNFIPFSKLLHLLILTQAFHHIFISDKFLLAKNQIATKILLLGLGMTEILKKKKMKEISILCEYFFKHYILKKLGLSFDFLLQYTVPNILIEKTLTIAIVGIYLGTVSSLVFDRILDSTEEHKKCKIQSETLSRIKVVPSWFSSYSFLMFFILNFCWQKNCFLLFYY